jgi:4-carboxymuconolactone decarboxylase
MSLLDPGERSARGASIKQEVTGHPADAPKTLYEESWRDFVYAEVWNRPGMDRRSRYLVSLSGAAIFDGEHDVELYAHGALKSGELSLIELREAALHLSIYAGWSRGGVLDRAVTRAAEALGLDPVALPPLRAEAWDPEVRDREGGDEFTAVMTFPGGPPATPYLQAIRNFVFGEMWPRYEGLDQRSRRWITLVGVCASNTMTPMGSHIYAAMKSGNCAIDEMQEFVLQYGIHAGWPSASVVQSIVFEQSKRVAAGLPFEA